MEQRDQNDSSLPEADIKASVDTAWQKNLLPLIKKMVVGITIFFFLISLVQLFYLHAKISRPDNPEINRVITSVRDTTTVSLEERITLMKMKALVLLENESLERRHHQANVSLMSRIWIKYLGFVTGMILALLGSLFIIGKFEEKASKLAAKTVDKELLLTTASPGIFMATLGTILMIITIFNHHDIEVNDGTIYINSMEQNGATAGESKKPPFIIESNADSSNQK